MFREIDSFRREIDLYNFIFDFFVGNEICNVSDDNDLLNTIVIQCEAVNDPKRLVHYLHSRYLIEKAMDVFINCVYLSSVQYYIDKK